MSTSLGSLVVELSANMAKFQSDMGKAAHIAQENMEKIDKAAELAKRGLEALGIGLGVRELVEFIGGTLEAADNLGKMAQKVGIGVEALSALKYSAALSDISLEQLGIGLTKLSKNMLSVEQGTANAIQAIDGLGVSAKGGAAAAFNQLGINVEASKGHLKSSEQVLIEVADKFVKMHDGALKTALAMQIFGKSGADLIPLLNQGGAAIKAQREEAERLGIVISTDMAKASEEFNDNMTRLKAASEGAKISLVKDLIPSLTETAQAMVDLVKEGHPVLALLRGFAGLGKIPFDFAFPDEKFSVKGHIEELKKGLSDLENMRSGLAKNASGIGFVDKWFWGDKNDLDRKIMIAKNQIEAFQKFGDKLPKPKSKETETPKTDPALRSTGAGAKKSSADDPTKNLLANNLKIQEALVSREADILSSRNKFIDQYNSDNLLSIKDYYAAKKAAQDDNITATLALYDKEIAELKAYADKATKATDRADATSKINDLLAKKAKLEQSAAEAGIIGGLQEAKAFKDLATQIGSVNAQVFELTGNLHAAAVIRFDQQNDSLRARFTGNPAALAQLDTLKQYTVAQADLNKITQDATLIKDAAANAEARIGLSQKAGALSELGSLQAISDVRQKEVADLQTLYDNYQKIATASGNPKLLQDADNMKLALEKLRGESDLVAQKFQTIFTDSFSTAFTDFIMGTKSAGDAFKSFAQSVIQQIIKIEAQKLATSLFSDSGGSSGGGGWGAAFSSIVGSLFKADGGPVNANRPYIVGERGPEMFLPSVSGSIVPNHALGASGGNSSGDVSITVNVSDSGQQSAGSGNNAELGRRIAGVVKGIIIDERRPGGLLAA
ncbi:hypothetical protein [Sulfuriferula sp.]|uniref:hypothetical protein n=1 Tax=Sulfuriferula sp. TaxID=2025307 RepID=UPI002730A112|nr:hypothetical protein [Sulfuriferula sp.]MDP2026452.1 hypothetical protein [Sulfuriferula sp.]